MIELKIDAQICSNQTVVDTKACKSAFFSSYLEMFAPKKIIKIQIISSKELKRMNSCPLSFSHCSMFKHHSFDVRRKSINVGSHMILTNSIIELEMLIPLG